MRAVRLTGADLDSFLAHLDYVRTHRATHTGLSVAVDDEGVKLKLDGTWSPGRGEPVDDGTAHVELDAVQSAAVEITLVAFTGAGEHGDRSTLDRAVTALREARAAAGMPDVSTTLGGGHGYTANPSPAATSCCDNRISDGPHVGFEG